MNKKVKAIRKDALNFILEIGESAHPEEMVGMLTAKKKVITDMVLAPGTYTSDKSAVMRVNQLPMGLNTVGSVHSHPSGNISPSKTDLEMFSKNGDFHIITGYPFEKNNWVCYNRKGEERELEVRDIENKEEDNLWEKELERLKEDIDE
ncbi:metal-dependent protease of the PAD1/JAB1 superfamily [archaeon SCG-AAA382B04]|nr:metal-dependent protease of the PAD1/JAB1 superfamily [archaeon SCG-AAA382B04]